jgi:hypothetical protein
MRIITAVAIALSVTMPAHAEVTVAFPVSIPQECVTLAQREGVPIVIENKYQAAKAKLKLARLSGKDPLVVECRAAVERAKAQAAAAARTTQPVQGSGHAPMQGMRSTIGQSEIQNRNRNDAIRSEAIP